MRWIVLTQNEEVSILSLLGIKNSIRTKSPYHPSRNTSGSSTMSLALVSAAIFIVAAFLFYRCCLYPAVLSPLARLPNAHPLSPFTSIWFENIRKNQRVCKTIYQAHRKHGCIVRLSPTEISVASLEGLRKIYIASLEKTEWYLEEFMNYGTPNMVSMTDQQSHAAQKRVLSGVYAKSYIQNSPDVQVLSRAIIYERFLPILDNAANGAVPVDVLMLSQWAGSDFQTAYLFGLGRGSNFLQDRESRDQYFGPFGQFRSTDFILNKSVKEDMLMKWCTLAAENFSAGGLFVGDQAAKLTEAVVFEKLYKHLSIRFPVEEKNCNADVLTRCASEMMDHLIAAQETTGITMTYVLWRMSQDRELQNRLRSELRSLRPSMRLEEQALQLPSVASIDRLPLLNAVLYETLRLHAAAPNRQPRVVPPGGLVLHGYYIPPGTTVSSNAYTLHRSDEGFANPVEWLPQRWLSDDSSTLRRWFWAFGSGGR